MANDVAKRVHANGCRFDRRINQSHRINHHTPVLRYSLVTDSGIRVVVAIT